MAMPPMGFTPQPTLEEMLLQRLVSQQQLQVQQQPSNPLLNWFSAAAADPMRPINPDGTPVVQAPVRPAPRPIQQVPIPASTPQRPVPPSMGRVQLPQSAPQRPVGAPIDPGLAASLFYKPPAGAPEVPRQQVIDDWVKGYKPPAPPAATTTGEITGIDQGWQRILQIEGGLNSDGTFRVNRSSGAVGPAQMLPSTGPEAARLAGVPWNEQKFRSDRAYNEKLGKAYYNMLVQRYKGDLTTAALAYHSGMGNVESGNIGPAGRDYVAKFGGELGIGGTGANGLVPNFDPSAYNNALGANNEAIAAAMTPFSADVKMAPRPEMPDLLPSPKLDFTKQDEWLGKMKPTAPTKETLSAISRREMFAGLAQGLASTPEDAHWGKVLANVGAGMLAGKMAGNAEGQARMDKFDEQMDRWEALNFANEKDKAQLAYNAAEKEVDAINQHNYKKLAYELEDYNKRNNVTVQNGMLMQSTQTADGMRVTTTPIKSLVLPGLLQNKAQIYMGMGNAQNQALGAQANMVNGVILQGAIQNYQQDKAADPGNMGMPQSLGMVATQVMQSGMGANIFGDDGWTELNKSASEAARKTGAAPGTDLYDETYNTDLAASIILQVQKYPQYMEIIQKQGGLLSSAQEARRARDATTTRSRKVGNERVTERY